MPSGHSIIAGFFSIFIFHHINNTYNISKDKQLELLLYCFIFTTYTMYSRILFGCHTLQQTIIGAFIGIIYGHIFYTLNYKYYLKKKQLNHSI